MRRNNNNNNNKGITIFFEHNKNRSNSNQENPEEEGENRENCTTTTLTRQRSYKKINNNHNGTTITAGTTIHGLPLLLLLALIVFAVAALDSMERVDALTAWRMRTDKKAMRNSLVRFGKRAYRPAGEAFVVGAVEQGGAVAPVLLIPGGNGGIARMEPTGALRAFYAAPESLMGRRGGSSGIDGRYAAAAPVLAPRAGAVDEMMQAEGGGGWL